MLCKDPNMEWDDFPYDVMAEAGLSPDSSNDEFRKQGRRFFKKQGRRDEVRPVVDRLTRVSTRLALDFYLHRSEVLASFQEVSVDHE